MTGRAVGFLTQASLHFLMNRMVGDIYFKKGSFIQSKHRVAKMLKAVLVEGGTRLALLVLATPLAGYYAGKHLATFVILLPVSAARTVFGWITVGRGKRKLVTFFPKSCEKKEMTDRLCKALFFALWALPSSFIGFTSPKTLYEQYKRWGLVEKEGKRIIKTSPTLPYVEEKEVERVPEQTDPSSLPVPSKKKNTEGVRETQAQKDSAHSSNKTSTKERVRFLDPQSTLVSVLPPSTKKIQTDWQAKEREVEPESECSLERKSHLESLKKIINTPTLVTPGRFRTMRPGVAWKTAVTCTARKRLAFLPVSRRNRVRPSSRRRSSAREQPAPPPPPIAPSLPSMQPLVSLHPSCETSKSDKRAEGEDLQKALQSRRPLRRVRGSRRGSRKKARPQKSALESNILLRRSVMTDDEQSEEEYDEDWMDGCWSA